MLSCSRRFVQADIIFLCFLILLKQRVKTEQIKRKQTCSVCFVKLFKFQENKFKIV